MLLLDEFRFMDASSGDVRASEARTRTAVKRAKCFIGEPPLVFMLSRPVAPLCHPEPLGLPCHPERSEGSALAASSHPSARDAFREGSALALPTTLRGRSLVASLAPSP